MFFCQFLLGTNIQYTSPINVWFPSHFRLNQVGNQLQLFSIQTKCISLNVVEEITINSDEQIAWNQVYLWKMIDRENCKKKMQKQVCLMKKVMMLRSRENCAKPGSPKAADERWLSQLLPGNEQLYGQHCTCWLWWETWLYREYLLWAALWPALQWLALMRRIAALHCIAVVSFGEEDGVTETSILLMLSRSSSIEDAV